MILKGLSREERIAYMIANKADVKQMKKAAIKYADASHAPMVIPGDNSSVIKALSTSNADDTPDSIKRTVIGNTYLWLDSHGDVHLENTFTESIKQRGDKIFHLHDHLYQVSAKVGKPINVYEQQVSWKDLGVNKPGSTISLMMDTEILRSYNAQIFDQYKDAQIDQHSVGMYYVGLDLAVDNEEYEEEYKLYQSVIGKLGNPEKAEEAGYFWAVREAKLIEISAVLQGSNEITPTIEAKTEEDIEEDLAAKAAADRESARKTMLLKHLGC